VINSTLDLHDYRSTEGPGAEPAEKLIAGGAILELLEQTFGASFAVLDAERVEQLRGTPDLPHRDWGDRAAVCREVAQRGRAELIDEDDPFATLAVPLIDSGETSLVAVRTFVTRPVSLHERLTAPAAVLGCDERQTLPWASRQLAWSAESLLRIGQLVLDQWKAGQRIAELEEEAGTLSVHLASTYEEISLLYRLTQNLKISESDDELGRIALEWLHEVLPATAVAIQLVPVAPAHESLNYEVRRQDVLLTYGDFPIDQARFTRLIDHLDAGSAMRPLVVNRQVTAADAWPCPDVRQMIVVPLSEGDNLFGYLAALNHTDDDEFGTVEASLLSSVAAILGIHSGNIELYRQQSELLAGIIRALTSAIDAKDPYTCGHSDRVARIAVRLAEQLGCDANELHTIYLAGLLHDIGKIGISDSVLRKPDKLSDKEYEHIKTHVEVGHRILRDLKKLEGVLPVVLHHHESWDGGGYPHQLNDETIPLPARIVAVADSFDAMSSDRPYRKGMPLEKIDEIFRSGAGQQWDPKVVDAYFHARDDILRIAEVDHEHIEIPLPRWR